jgi:hypothetical protein
MTTIRRVLLWVIALPILLVIWPVVLGICSTITIYYILTDEGKEITIIWRLVGACLCALAIWLSIISERWIYHALNWLWHRWLG